MKFYCIIRNERYDEFVNIFKSWIVDRDFTLYNCSKMVLSIELIYGGIDFASKTFIDNSSSVHFNLTEISKFSPFTLMIENETQIIELENCHLVLWG